jgi:hypothetical protein
MKGGALYQPILPGFDILNDENLDRINRELDCLRNVPIPSNSSLKGTSQENLTDNLAIFFSTGTHLKTIFYSALSEHPEFAANGRRRDDWFEQLVLKDPVLILKTLCNKYGTRGLFCQAYVPAVTSTNHHASHLTAEDKKGLIEQLRAFYQDIPLDFNQDALQALGLEDPSKARNLANKLGHYFELLEFADQMAQTSSALPNKPR